MSVPIEDEPYNPNAGNQKSSGGWFSESPSEYFRQRGLKPPQQTRIKDPSTWKITDFSKYSQRAWEGAPLDTYQRGNDTYARGFWENPQRVLRYTGMMDAGNAPNWVNQYRNELNTALTYMQQRYAGTPQDQWDYLPDDDPLTEILRAIPAPEHPDVLAAEAEYEEKNDNLTMTGDYNSLSLAQKSLMLLLNPGVITGRTEKQMNRAEWVNPITPTLMMGLAGAGLTKSPIVGGIIGLTVYLQEHQKLRNQMKPSAYLTYDNIDVMPYQNPKTLGEWGAKFGSAWKGMNQRKWETLSIEKRKELIDNINKKIDESNTGKGLTIYDKTMEVTQKVFNFFSETAERNIGALSVAIKDEDFATVFDIFNVFVEKEHTKALREASNLYYESGAMGYTLTDLVGSMSGETRKNGEVWKVSQGVRGAVKADGLRGNDAISQMAQLIENGADPDSVIAEFRDKFGVEGQINDFVLQTIFDPLNFMPAIGAGTVKLMGKATGDVKMYKAGADAGWNFKFKDGKMVDKSSGKTVEIKKTSPLKTAGDIIADIIPGGNLLFPAITKRYITGSSGLLGALAEYKAFMNTGGYTAPANLTRMQKFFAGLDMKTGLPKNTDIGVSPTGRPKIYKNPYKWAKYMRELDPVSKALAFSYNVMDVITMAWEGAGGDIAQFRRVLDAIGKARNNQTAAVVDAVLNPPGQNKVLMTTEFYNSPIVVSVADAVQKFLDSGKFDDVVNLMNATAPIRNKLSKLAKILGTTPGEIVKTMHDKQFNFADKYSKLDATQKVAADEFLAELQLTPSGLDDWAKLNFEPFLKKVNPVPYSQDLFGRSIAHQFYGSMGEYMAKRFGITEDPIVFRLSNAMKAVQSIVLLGVNPRYFINNEINNIVTRMATGVFGYVKDYDKTVDRYRIDVARGDIEANFMTFGEVEGLPKGIGDRNKKAKGQVIEKFGRGAKEVNAKIGLMSKLSAVFEKMESKNTFIIAFQDMFKNVFKPMLPDDLRLELDTVQPGLANQIEFLARAGANMDEILKNIQGEYIIPEATVQALAKEYAAHHQNVRGMADIYAGMMVRSGMLDELYEAFKDIKNPTEADVNRIFDELMSKKVDFASKLMEAEIETHIEDLKARLATGSNTEVQQIITEIELKHQLNRLNVLVDLDRVFQMKGVLSPEGFRQYYNQAVDRHTALYEDNAKYDIATYKTMLEQIGIAADDPQVLQFINSYKRRFEINRDFNAKKRAVLEKAFEEAKGKPDFDKRMDKAREEVEKLSKQATEAEALIQDEADLALYHMMGDKPEVLAWREDVKKIRNQLHDTVNKFRSELADAVKTAKKAGNPLPPSEINMRWSKFFFEDYFPKFTEVLYAEVDGAQKIWAGSTPGMRLFEEWFRGSKVVDANNKPIVVYHGTTRDFGVFSPDAEKSTTHKTNQLGFFFTESPSIATDFIPFRDGSYPLVKADGANLRPSYVVLRNPIEISHQEFLDIEDVNGWKEQAIADGYDGVIIRADKSVADSMSLDEFSATNYVAFYPEQVRSAIEPYSAMRKRAEALTKNVTEGIAAIADKTRRTKAVHDMGRLTRDDVVNELYKVFPKEEVDANIALMDAHANVLAKQGGYIPDDATRDAWYASHIVGATNDRATGNYLEQVDRETLWDYKPQKITSEKTSINKTKVPSVFNSVAKKEGWVSGTRNLDIGGGKYDTATEYLDKNGVNNLIYDPFNRSKQHNDSVVKELSSNPVDTVTISNVLNVLSDYRDANRVLAQAYDALKYDGKVYISVYEGDGSGLGYETKSGFQWNRKLKQYLFDIKQIFPDAEIKGDYIVGTKTEPSAAMGIDDIKNSLYQEATASTRNWYYSQLEKVLQTMPNKMTKEALKGFLSGRVKVDELEWTGFLKWVDDQTGQISKQDALDFIINNQVKVEESIHGELKYDRKLLDRQDEILSERIEIRRKLIDIDRKIENELLNKGIDQDRISDMLDRTFTSDDESLINANIGDDLLSERIALQIQLQNLEYERRNISAQQAASMSAPKYSTYILPGGENYRELLLTLPEQRSKIAWTPAEYEEVKELASKMRGDFGQVMTPKDTERWEQLQKRQNRANTIDYKSPHWEEPNVLAHIRFNDRVDADGKRVLFIEEIQSDWHQAGRERGYSDGLPKEYKAPPSIVEEIRNPAYPDGEADVWIVSNPDTNFKRTIQKVTETENRNMVSTGKVYPPDPMREHLDELFVTQPYGEDGYWDIALQEPDNPRLLITGRVYLDKADALKQIEQWKSDELPPVTNTYYVVNQQTRFDTLEGAIENSKTVLENIAINAHRNEPDTRPPSAPFSKNWEELAIKRAIRYAAENGYDRVAWTTGQMQVERYNLAKQVDHIRTTRKSDGTYEVSAISLDRSYEVLRETYKPEQLPGVIGKDLADKIVSSERDINEWRGDDLRVGGEGMKAFYDQKLPNIVRKYIKKWGSDVGETKFITNKAGDRGGGWIDQEVSVKTQSFDITDAMRRSVIEEGQPLFQAKQGSVTFGDDGAAVIRAFDAKDSSTLVHEVGHIFRRDLNYTELDVVAKLGGLADADELKRLEVEFQLGNIKKGDADYDRYEKAEEMFARGWERYLLEGKAPIPELKSVFDKFTRWLYDIYKSVIGKNKKPFKNSVIGVDIDREVGGVSLRTIFDRMLAGEEGDATVMPSNTVPQSAPQTVGSHEMLHNHIVPFLESMREKMVNEVRNKGTKFTNLSPEQQKKVMDWARGLRGEMTQAKYASIKYAQIMRDLTMLNYQQKTNFDHVLNTVFPYQFWFTNTMRNWMMRSVDRASWYNMYFRWKTMQERLEKDGLPTRLANKMGAPAGFLPEWMGDTVWFDPMAQIFPFTQMFQPFENFARMGSDVEHDAITILYEMRDNDEITAEQLDQAIAAKDGELWNTAYELAAQNADKDPLTLASLMMSPSMPIDIVGKILAGRGDEIALTPMAKTSQALRSQVGWDTATGKALGIPSWLENNIRKAAGMSPGVALFGKYGDYYIERRLADMAFDGTASLDEVMNAMLSHQGDLYNQAIEDVARQLSLKVPGMLTVEAIRGGAKATDVVSSFFTSFFPLGLLPQGELKYKNLQIEHNKAWEYYKATADKSKVREFYDAHPEYSARTALYEKDPEQRMKQYVIGKIQDAYFGAPKANQQAMRTALGEEFQTAFLDQEASEPSMLSLQTLLTFARQLNLMFPKNPVGVEMPDEIPVEQVEMFSADVVADYQEFLTQRDALYPYWSIEQDNYYNRGDEEPSSYLESYWDWKEDYIAMHPKVAIVIESAKSPELSKYKDTDISDLDPLVLKQLSAYYSDGKPMSSGAWELLHESWVEMGKPFKTFDYWMKRSVQPAVTGVPSTDDSNFYKLTDMQERFWATYVAEKDRKFPNIKEANDAYWAVEGDKAAQRQVVDAYPILREYWDWIDAYEKAHPEIVAIKKILNGGSMK